MKVEVVKIGEELGFLLPDNLVVALGADRSGFIDVSVEDGVLVLRPANSNIDTELAKPE
jgi:antitoxin component of MazEF toxin-antitoxin module